MMPLIFELFLEILRSDMIYDPIIRPFIISAFFVGCLVGAIVYFVIICTIEFFTSGLFNHKTDGSK